VFGRESALKLEAEAVGRPGVEGGHELCCQKSLSVTDESGA
jgi:hypothetical protein